MVTVKTESETFHVDDYELEGLVEMLEAENIPYEVIYPTASEPSVSCDSDPIDFEFAGVGEGRERRRFVRKW